MTALCALIKRNSKLFFKDKGMFFTSLITPLILLVLYATFLAEVYKDSFALALPTQLGVEQRLIDGTVGAQLFSSLLAVCCVTVSFCANMLMIQDKSSRTLNDLKITPVKSSVLSLGYYISTLISTLLICFVAMGACFVYLAFVGWYLVFSDALLLLLDIFLLVMFGTGLSSVINFFLSTQGQMSAVGTVVSAGYGFVCGAYMPISQFSEGLRDAIMFFPGTYATALLRNHAMRGCFAEMKSIGIPADIIDAIKDSVDCNLYFFDTKVSIAAMYGVIVAVILLLVVAYVLMNRIKAKVHYE